MPYTHGQLATRSTLTLPSTVPERLAALEIGHHHTVQRLTLVEMRLLQGRPSSGRRLTMSETVKWWIATVIISAAVAGRWPELAFTVAGNLGFKP